jgi:selT/selW/selH-like putative selenoprotein
MKRNFNSVRMFLEENYPELKGRIGGGNYPPPPIVELLLKCVTAIQVLAMALMLFGDRFWTSVLRMRYVPSWYYPIKEYGFQCGLAVFFLLPQLLNQFVVTGAFEIIVDGNVGFSKLETGRMPTAQEIQGIFEKLGMASALS